MEPSPPRDPAPDCKSLFTEAATFVIDEQRRNGETPVEWNEGWQLRSTPELRTILANSQNPEQLFTATLLVPGSAGSDPASEEHRAARERFIRLAAGTHDPVLAHHGLLHCMAETRNCSPAIEQDLLGVDRNNAESWVVVATIRHARGDTAGALAAMQAAATAPSATSYWGETIDLVERALRGMTDSTFAERFIESIGLVASRPFAVPIARICAAEAAASPEWAAACTGFAALRIQQRDTAIALMTGHSIREKTFLARGEIERAAEAASEREREQKDFMAWQSASAGVTVALVTSNEARMQDHFEAIIQHGEIEGMRSFLRQELPPLFARAGLDRRDEAGRCLALFADE